MNKSLDCGLLVIALQCAGASAAPVQGDSGEYVELAAETLRDKIRGGLLGQMLGNLNGLQHENQYIHEPGDVKAYTPALPDGARTDDDTDLEWVYVVAMQSENEIYLSPERIAQLWKARINRRIWCSNQYARQLMDLGLTPPTTGRFALNPWAEFNISGQFLCETFGLLAPGMPQTAARIGLNYTTVAIDLEPAQTTQLFTSMIAAAFFTDDVDEILDAGLASLDPGSVTGRIVNDVRAWRREHPVRWRTTRRLIAEKYTRYGGTVRDYNGYELNTAATIAALLYGDGDFVETVKAAYNFGWDCDNTAATAGTVMGVVKGYRWMLSQGWRIVDRYANTTRQNMPMDETITSFADRLCDLAERVICDGGGARTVVNGRPVYRIRRQEPASVAKLPSLAEQLAELQSQWKSEIETGVAQGASDERRARAAYLAICLELAKPLSEKRPDEWAKSVEALSRYRNVVQAIYHYANVPGGARLRAQAAAAGLAKPAKRERLWQ